MFLHISHKILKLVHFQSKILNHAREERQQDQEHHPETGVLPAVSPWRSPPVQHRHGFVWFTPSAGTLQYQLPFLLIFATGFTFPARAADRALPPRLEHFITNAATHQDVYLLNRLLCHLPFTPGARRRKCHRHFVICEIKALLLF